MALTDEGNSGIPATMLVGPANFAGAGTPYPVYMGGGSGSGNSGGWDNGNGWWIILLFILLASGNWGNNGNGNGGGMFGGAPIVVNDGGGSSVQRGFDQAAIMSGITGVQSGVQGLSTQLCNCCCDMQGTVNNGFFGVQNALCNGFNGVEQGANARQMSNMQTAFGLQTAVNQGFNSLGSQLADCCCENRLASADLKYTIATENCADRAAIESGIRDVITNNTANTQAILDKLCQLELDGVKAQLAQAERENVGLQNQLNMASFRESQTAQNALITQGFSNEVDALYNRLNSCPVPTTPVYGRTPIFTCGSNNGCGCGCGNGAF